MASCHTHAAYYREIFSGGALTLNNAKTHYKTLHILKFSYNFAVCIENTVISNNYSEFY